MTAFAELQTGLARMFSTAPALEARRRLLNRCVLSASGLRFVCGDDEQSLATQAPREAVEFVICAANLHATLMHDAGGNTVWLGMDTRPTGPQLMTALFNLYTALGFRVRCMSQGPIPQIMAATRADGAAGFCYLTASHNPAGHNGLKLGLADGSVLDGARAKKLIGELRTGFLDEKHMSDVLKLVDGFKPALPADFESSISRYREQARHSYADFVLSTIAPGVEAAAWKAAIRHRLGSRRPKLLFDMNGSSRLLGIDRELMAELGFEVHAIGEQPGVFKHAILPEGESLVPACQLMQTWLDAGDDVLAALVPDCDGDRGNLILPRKGVAMPLQAQENFLVCTLAEITACRASGYAGPLSVAVNCATSGRVQHMLKHFDATVEKAEVGEINVVTKAVQCRERGARVPISGEGSNGGSIIHPSTVRDPLLTLLSLVKFLFGETSEAGVSPLSLYLRKVGATNTGHPVDDLLASLPAWHTTETFEPEALMPVPKIEHELLKSRYEERILNHFKTQPQFWNSKGIERLRIVSTEGTENIPGPGHRPAPGRGGLSIFMDGRDGELGFLWMRGSGTEPVFRIVVDWRGEAKDYQALMDLHRGLIVESAAN